MDRRHINKKPKLHIIYSWDKKVNDWILKKNIGIGDEGLPCGAYTFYEDFEVGYFDTSSYDSFFHHFIRRLLRHLIYGWTAQFADPWLVWIQRHKIRQAAAVLTYSDAEALGLAFWRLFGLFKHVKHLGIMVHITDGIRQDKSMRYKRRLTKLLEQVDVIGFLAPGQREIVADELRLPIEKLVYLKKGLDLEFFKSDTEYFGGTFLFSPGNDKDRDFVTLVEALRHSSHQLVIALGGSFKATFEQHDNVTVLRNLSKLELRWLYQRARVVLVITKANSHGSGLTVIKEAMAMARPVIATDTPGLRDIIEPEKTGFLVPVGDIKAIRQAVESITNNPDLGRKIGLAGREFVINDRCFQHNNRESADVLLKLLGPTRSQ